MGGERFDTAMPEMYLFGENADLNFLGSRPAPVSLINYFNLFLLYYIKKLQVIFSSNIVIFSSCVLFIIFIILNVNK